jgi:PAS domain S-box-containing protein
MDELRARLEQAELRLSEMRNREMGVLTAVGNAKDGKIAGEVPDKPYQIFFEGMCEGAAALSPNGNVLLANSGMAAALRISEQELARKNIMDLIAPGSRQTFQDWMTGTDRTAFRIELPFLRPDGSTVPMHVTLNGLNNSRRAIILMTVLDLSGMKGIEAELKRSHDELEEKVREKTRELQETKALMETILMQMPAGVAVVDHAGNLVIVNGEMNKILTDLTYGLENARSIGSKDVGVSKDQLEKVVNHVVGSVLEADLDNRFELEYNRSNGTRGHLSIRSAPVKDINGKVEGGVRLILDVSETVEMQKERQELLDRLRRSNQELQQFVSVASHDLKEPLRMVSNYVGLIKKRYEGKLDPDADEFIGFAVDGAKRMQFLIDDLLRYSRVDTKTEPFRLVDLKEVMEIVIKDQEDDIRTAGARIVLDELPSVSGDRSQMIQLMQNLVSNAVKFKGAAPPMIEISSSREEGAFFFSVKDNGIGIPEGCNDRIFQMFQRAHIGKGFEGTGIGLAICKKIVERHGGRIWVESDGQSGSTFCFTIPIEPEHNCYYPDV